MQGGAIEPLNKGFAGSSMPLRLKLHVKGDERVGCGAAAGASAARRDREARRNRA
jgi:hypothetical protein